MTLLQRLHDKILPPPPKTTFVAWTSTIQRIHDKPTRQF